MSVSWVAAGTPSPQPSSNITAAAGPTLTATTSTPLLIWPSPQVSILRPPGRAPSTTAQRQPPAATATPTPPHASLPASVAAFSASRHSSLTGMSQQHAPAPPQPHTPSPLGQAPPHLQPDPPSGQGAWRPTAGVAGSDLPLPEGAPQPRQVGGPFGSAFAQASASVNAGDSSNGDGHRPGSPPQTPPPSRPSLDAATSAAHGAVPPGRGASPDRQQPHAHGGTMPLRAGSSQSMVSLAGAASAMPSATAVPALQGSSLAPEADLPSVIDYPLYSTQCKIRWQAVTEAQLASQFAPSAASHTRLQGRRRDRHQHHSTHSYSQQGLSDDLDSESLLGSESGSESNDEGEEGSHHNSYRNASTYSGSDYRFSRDSLSPRSHLNGAASHAVSLADGERDAASAHPDAHGGQNTSHRQPVPGLQIASAAGTATLGAAGRSSLDSRQAGSGALPDDTPTLDTTAAPGASRTHGSGAANGRGARGLSGAAQSAVSMLRSVLSAPPPTPTPSQAGTGAGAGLPAGGGVRPAALAGGGAWGSLSHSGGRKAVVFGKSYMLSSGSHPLVRIVLQRSPSDNEGGADNRCRPSMASAASTSISIAAPPADDRSSVTTSDLDWRPSLSLPQEVSAMAASVLLACLLYAFTAPTAISISYGAGIAAAAAGSLSLLRRGIIESLYKEHQRPVQQLGDSDSLFPRLDGLTVHVKASVGPAAAAALSRMHRAGSGPSDGGLASWRSSISSDSADSTSELPQHRPDQGWSDTQTSPDPLLPPMHEQAPRQQREWDGQGEVIPVVHCYHGFGANLFSYEPVVQRLAAAVGGVVSAHDCPGFGLTERPTSLGKYFLEYNGRLGRLSSDFAVDQLCEGGGWTGAQQQADLTPSAAARASLESNASELTESSCGSDVTQPQRPKPRMVRVLVGHSLGGICAAMEALRVPGEVAALVLVAPAIITSSKAAPPPPTPSSAGSSSSSNAAGGDSKADTQSSSRSEPRRHSTSSVSEGASAHSSQSGLTSSAFTADTTQVSAAATPPGRPATSSEGAVHTTTAPGDSTPPFPSSTPTPPSSSAVPAQPQAPSGSAILQRSLRLLRAIAASFAALAVLLLVRLSSPAIAVLLRALVRSKAFWVKGLRSAYQDPAKLSSAMVDHYRLPQLVRGWEQGMINFLCARLSHLTDIQGMLKVAWTGSGAAAGAAAAAAVAAGAASTASSPDMQLAQRLGRACASGELAVLIVHGKQDRLVPVGNSMRLAAAIPGCQVVLYDSCGHTPQEEMPLEFERDVAQFVNSLKNSLGVGLDGILMETGVTHLSGLVSCLENLERMLAAAAAAAPHGGAGKGVSRQVEQLTARVDLLFKVSARLKRLADVYNLAVLVVNQVVDVFEKDGGTGSAAVEAASRSARAPSIMSSAHPLTSSGRQVLPALGLAWSNCVNTRLFLSREVGLDRSIARKLQVVWASHLPPSECNFTVQQDGIHGLPPCSAPQAQQLQVQVGLQSSHAQQQQMEQPPTQQL
ncbi:MAG: hypothetical protein WDW36_010368 [Sanguina aurantia]